MTIGIELFVDGCAGTPNHWKSSEIEDSVDTTILELKTVTVMDIMILLRVFFIDSEFIKKSLSYLLLLSRSGCATILIGEIMN